MVRTWGWVQVNGSRVIDISQLLYHRHNGIEIPRSLVASTVVGGGGG